MTQYINKSALVAEIERRIKHYNESAKEFGDEGYNDNVLMEQCKANACKYILSFLDTLEVKEVDLEKEIDRELETRWRGEYLFTSKFRESAKHFFELGLKAQKEEKV